MPPTNFGIGCCGSPTDRLIGGLPGLMSAIRSVSRTKGERLVAGVAGGVCGAAEAIGPKSRERPAQKIGPDHRSARVKARLTNKNLAFRHFRTRANFIQPN